MQRSSKKRSVNDTRKIRVRTPVIQVFVSLFAVIANKAGNPFAPALACRAFPLAVATARCRRAFVGRILSDASTERGDYSAELLPAKSQRFSAGTMIPA